MSLKLYPTCSLRQKNVLLSSNSCNFNIKPNILTKFVAYGLNPPL